MENAALLMCAGCHPCRNRPECEQKAGIEQTVDPKIGVAALCAETREKLLT